ncbi:MAG: CcmD family protein [Polyangiales bacterium]
MKPDEQPSASRSTTFQAVEGPREAEVSGGALLLAAYGVVWLLLLLFVWRLGRLQRRLGRELHRLQTDLPAPTPTSTPDPQA